MGNLIVILAFKGIMKDNKAILVAAICSIIPTGSSYSIKKPGTNQLTAIYALLEDLPTKTCQPNPQHEVKIHRSPKNKWMKDSSACQIPSAPTQHNPALKVPIQMLFDKAQQTQIPLATAPHLSYRRNKLPCLCARWIKMLR
jgi:hypothetical protein